MDFRKIKLAEPEIKKISKSAFLKLSPEKQKEYLRLYRTQIIPKLSVLREHHRFYTIHGGRGSGKSTSVAKWLLQKMTAEQHTLLCTREIQNSLAESSYQMLVDMIEYQELAGWTVQKEKIYHENGSKIIFHGLRDNAAANSLKSVVNISLVWDRHHRLETHNSDGVKRLVSISTEELIALDMYYDRPASELIWLKKTEHKKLHQSCKWW